MPPPAPPSVRPPSPATSCRARQVAQNAELAYSKGALPLSDLLDARRTLRATALEALSARQDHAKALGAWQLRAQPQILLGSTP